jgi:cathepsin L
LYCGAFFSFAMMALRTFAALGMVVASSARGWRGLSAQEKGTYTYTDFLVEFSKSRSAKSESTFLANLAKIHAHNARNETWTAGVNQFTDMTAEEFKAYYAGYVPNMPGTLKVSNAPADILEAKAEDFAASVDWRSKESPKGGKVLTDVKNQGGCGSCWAFSATESIEADVAIETGTLPDLAPQQFVDCAPNPLQCGGTGGCQGATAEIAFNYTIAAGGQEGADVYKYTAHTDTCKFDKLPKPKFSIKSYVKLPINKYDPLIAAVNQQPISISVDASRWSMYERGVYTGCPHGIIATVDIDHAVQLVGYGTDVKPYFIVRNSWGPTWGEEGFIRIDATSAKAGTCYNDPTPGDGNGCKGGAKKMTVCGACGILSDSSYPTGGHAVTGH